MELKFPITEEDAIDALIKMARKNPRNYLLFTCMLNMPLRTSDICTLQLKHLWDFKQEKPLKHFEFTERKTGKKNIIYINLNVTDALEHWMTAYPTKRSPDHFLFFKINSVTQNVHIKRHAAWHVVRNLGESCGMEGVSPYVIRKTFGELIYKRSGNDIVLVMELYQHSSVEVTQRYLNKTEGARENAIMNLLV